MNARQRHPEPHAPTTPQVVYLWISGVFVTSLLMANVLGVKLFSIDTGIRGLLEGDATLRIEHTVGMLPFPITFLLTDLLNEFYGKRAARRVTYIAFAMAALAFGMISAGRSLPILEGIPGTATEAAFEQVFGASSVMYIASICAFLIGSLLDILVFGLFHRMTGERLVWLRATGSTVVSQVFDSFIVTFLYFWVFPILLRTEAGPAEVGFVLRTALTGYILKFVIAVAVTPLIYLGRWFLMNVLKMRPAVVGSAAERA